jgi:maleamate amidohydrolase
MKDEDNVLGGFYGELPLGERPALLVVDFQRGFTEPELSPLACKCDEAVAATAELVRSFREVGPVFFTIVAYGPNELEQGIWRHKCSSLATLRHGSEACELDPRLGYDPTQDMVLYKRQASAFFGTSLATVLQAARCDTLYVAGATTSGCIRASVVDALQLGFAPRVVRDCVSDRSAAQHESNLIDMQSKYAEVIGFDDARRELQGLARGRINAEA